MLFYLQKTSIKNRQKQTARGMQHKEINLRQAGYGNGNPCCENDGQVQKDLNLPSISRK
jgi:hypothetical protein